MSDDFTMEDAYRAVGISTTRENLVLKEELAALRARHEKLREGCKALVEEWQPPKMHAVLHDDWDRAKGHSADELNALLEDE